MKEKIMAKGDPAAAGKPKAWLAELIATLPTMDFSGDTAIEEALKARAARHGLGFGDYQSVARLAVSGTNVGPSITGLFRVLEREHVKKRIECFLAEKRDYFGETWFFSAS